MEIVKPILSILICTTSARSKIIQHLLSELDVQMSFFNGKIELLINDHETDSVGKKRNDLLNIANGEWCCAIDSDDYVSHDYLNKIITKLISDNPDCLGISGIITTNGHSKMQWHISKDYKYWHQKGSTYYRTPNHISPIRTSIAKQAGFKDMGHGEDHDFSVRVLPFIKTESIIQGNIYHYRYRNDSLK